MLLNRWIVALGLGLLALMSGCVVREERVSYPQPVPVAEYGQVQNIGYVVISTRPSGAGVILGAIIGGVVGHQVGGGAGNALATGAGAFGGAVAGSMIEGRSRREDEAYRVQVRFDNGRLREFDFMNIGDLRIGDRVKFEGGQLHRL